MITKEAYSATNGTVRYNEIKLKVTYPLEAYEIANEANNGTVTINIPVKATFEGYNNPNEEFKNPYISNTAEDVITVTYGRTEGSVINFGIQVGTYVGNGYNTNVISKENALKYYNNDEEKTNDKYEVKWSVSRGNSGEIENIQLREQVNNYTDKFQKTDGTYEDMLPYSKNIGIYFTTPGAMFGEDGWIRVYNEKDELIHEFTSEDWNNYTKENPYMYETPVDHIRIETSRADKVSNFTVNHIKELHNEILTTNIPRETFDTFNKIQSYLSGDVTYIEGEAYQNLSNVTGTANYEEPIAIAQITNVTPTTLTTQEMTNMKITISTANSAYNLKAWKNGTFLLRFPEEVLLAEINDININNNKVNILGYDIYEQDGSYFLKILTENENPENYTMTIDANITPDPRKITATKNLELYAYNEECHNYKANLRAKDIYDVNGDGNTEDFVNYSTRSVQFIGPSTLLTTETASDYNEEGDEIKTTVAPQVAEIDKTQNNRTAKISVQITNNYSGNISGIVIIGKTPFAGNTSQILGIELGSTFTAKMTGEIELPAELQGIAKVYYSENETVNSDLSDQSNHWKTANEITDFSKIRTYAIDLSDYTIEKNEAYICTYEIEVPQDVNYNDVSYSTHAVYFYLETNEGKLKDQTETNKLGFRIARKYNLEINKVKQGTNTPIQGASFSVQEEGAENARIVASDSNGKIHIQDLYVGKVYSVKELKAPSDYVLNGETIKFTTTVDDNGELQVQKLEGNSNLSVVQTTEEEPAKVSFTVTNEPKYTFKLTKEDQNGNLVQGVRFNLTGKGLPTAGRTVTTNRNGELTITGLYPNEEYTLTEVYAEGYEYSEAPIKFKTVWNGNNLEAQVIEGSFKEQPTVDNTQEKQPIMSASIVNTKLGEYALVLGKAEKGTLNLLEGAVFRVTGKWLDNEYTTDENGELDVGPLYYGIEYTIEEIIPPTGYALSDNTVRFIVRTDEEGQPYLQILEGEIKPLADFETGEDGIDTYALESIPAIDKDGNIIDDKYVYFSANQVTMVLDNEPLFSLTKIDGETKTPLPNVKFAITKVEDDGTETTAVNSKGEVIGETQEIDGKTYQIITTDEQGRITEDLPEGYYKVVEVETLEGYQLPENEEDRTYFFGIGKTKPAVKEMVELWSQQFEGNGEITYTDSVATDDGGYIKIGYFSNTVTFDADETENGEELVLTSEGSNSDGVIIKYNRDNKIVWAKTYSGVDTINNNDQFNSITKLTDGSYLILGFESQTGSHNIFHLIYDNLGNLVEKFEQILTNLTSQGEKKIIQTSDGGFVAIARFNNTVTIPAENTVDNREIVINTNGSYDGLVIKYNAEHKVEWAKSFGGEKEDTIQDFIISSDNKIVLVGVFAKSLLIKQEDTINNQEITLTSYNEWNNDGFIIIFNMDGYVEKAEALNFGSMISIRSIVKKDNKYIISGYAGSNGVSIPGEKTVDGNPINLKGNWYVLEYNEQWKINYGTMYTTGTNGAPIKMLNTADEGYIQVGLFHTNATSIPADQTANNQEIKLTSNGQRDCLVLKFNKDNKVEWAGQFGSIADETDANIKSVIELPNNRYLIQVYLTAKATIPSEQTTLRKDLELLGRTTLIYNSEGKIEYTSSEVSSSSQYNSVIATDDGGQIAVGQMTGKLHIPAEQTSNDKEINLISSGNSNLLITKYNSVGKIDWTINFGGDGKNSQTVRGIVKNEDRYVIVGTISGNLYIDKDFTLNEERIDISSSGEKGILVEFTEEGKITNVKVAEGGDSYFHSIQKLDTGEIIVMVKASNNITIDYMKIDSLIADNTLLIAFNSDLSIKEYINMGISFYRMYEIEKMDDGGFVIAGTINNRAEQTISSELTTIGDIIIPRVDGQEDGFILRLNADKKIEYFKVIQPLVKTSQIDYMEDIVKTNDGGYIILWYGFLGAQGIEFTEDETATGEIIKSEVNNSWQTYLIKYNNDNKVEILQKVGDNTEHLVKAFITKDNEFRLISDKSIIGYTSLFEKQYTINPNGIYLDGVDNGDNTYTLIGYTTDNGVNVAKIAKFQENTISAEIPEQQEITVENYKKEYKITTEVEGEGGSISGQGSSAENPYEIVEDGADSTKDIVITPEEGYKILKITVNGEEINFVPEEDGSVILNKFTNMTSDKHVVVQFSNTVSTVIVHHYKDGTTEPDH